MTRKTALLELKANKKASRQLLRQDIVDGFGTLKKEDYEKWIATTVLVFSQHVSGELTNFFK